MPLWLGAIVKSLLSWPDIQDLCTPELRETRRNIGLHKSLGAQIRTWDRYNWSISVTCSSESVYFAFILHSSIPDTDKSFFSKVSKSTLDFTQLSVRRTQGTLSSVVKRPGYEAGHFLPCRTEVKNQWSCTSISPYLFMTYTWYWSCVRLSLFILHDYANETKINSAKTISFALQASRYLSRLNTSVKFIPLLIYWDTKTFLMPLQLNLHFYFPAVFHAASLFFSMRHAFLHLAGRKLATVCTRPQISTSDNTVSLVLIPTAASQ